MAHKAFTPNYFKQMIQTAKSGTVNYAFAAETKDGGPCFVLDDGLEPDALFQKVKSEKKCTKGSYGTCHIKSGAFLLTPVVKHPKLKPLVKQLAKKEGWTIKDCKVLGPDGREEDEEGEEETSEASAPASAPGAAPEPETATEPSSDAAEKVPLVWKKSLEAARKEADKLCKALRGTDQAAAKDLAQSIEKWFDDLPDLGGALDNFARVKGGASVMLNPRFINDSIAEAKKQVASVEKLLAASTVLDLLDNNPFVKITAGKTLGNALAALKKVV